MKETIIFFEIVALSFNILIPVGFLLVKAPLKLLFWYDVKLHVLFLLMLSSTPVQTFLFKNISLKNYQVELEFKISTDSPKYQTRYFDFITII